MTSGFGGMGYVAPSTRALTSITESPNPDAADFASPDKTAELIQTHDYQLKDLATQMKQVQKGVNDATANPIQQIQQFISDFIVLLGGGELAEGALDFGDLQYILPTLGALFGIGDGPFPLDLFAAAEKLFFGYVVPTKQFTDLINNMTGAWMNVFGIDPKFIKDTKALITAIGQLFGEVGNLLPSVNTFFDALNPGGGGTAGSALGPLGAALGPIIKLFAGLDLKNFGHAFEFVTAAMDPWIVKLTAAINFLNEVLAVLGSGQDVVNDPLPQVIVPIQNLVRFLGNIQFGIESFNPVTAVQTWLGQLLLPLGNLSTVQPNLQLNPGFDDSSDLGNIADGKNWTRENLDPPTTDNDWAWDLVGRTADGSATVHANGVDHGLLGNIIYVDEGHTFDFDTYLSWDGLTAATGALALHIQTNTGTNTVIDSVTSPAATSSWTHLTGSYTVPTGVTTIRLRLYVGADASAGQVWFDDLNIRRTNLIHQGLIQNLENDLAQLAGYFTTLLTNSGAGDVAALGANIATTASNAGSALTKIGDMITNAAVSTPAELGALAKTAQDNANQAGTNLQSILNNSEAATYAALGTLILTAANNAGSALAELGSIITNSAQADAAAVGTALAGAATNASNAIGQVAQIITNSAQADAAAVGTALANAAGQLSDIVTHSGQPNAAAVGTTVSTSHINSQGIIDAVVQAAQNDAGLINQTVTDAQTNLASFFSGLTAALSTGDTTSPPAASAADAVAAAGVIQERLAIIGNGAEEQVKVDFSAFSDGALPSEFTPFGINSGTAPSVSGGVLAVTGNSLEQDYRYNAATTLTDYQKVTGAWPTFVAGSGSTIPKLFGRIDSTETAYVFIEYDSVDNQWALLAEVSGSSVIVVMFDDIFTTDAEYALLCGDPDTANPYKFAILKNGVPLPLKAVIAGDTSQSAGQLYYIDTSHASTMGASNRSCGLGMAIGAGTNGTISMSTFGFQDTIQSSPSVLVTTAESTVSTTYTDLATVSDEVAVNIGSSGIAQVILGANISNSATTSESFMSFTMSGANTLAASDANAIMYQAFTARAQGTYGVTILLTDLNPGLTVFKAKYRCSSSTATFANRRLGVVAL